MSVYVCLGCYSEYEREYLQVVHGELNCPAKRCDGEVVELDEMIVPTIIALNQKGYITTYCCAGHFQHNHGYIAFEGDEYVPDIDGLPEIVKIDRAVIRWEFITDPLTPERIFEIGAFHGKMFVWAASLEPNEGWECQCDVCVSEREEVSKEKEEAAEKVVKMIKKDKK